MNQKQNAEFDQQQNELIEKYRDINVDHDDWHDAVWEDYAIDMIQKGIDAEDMNYSGFWSQGDGASFIGKINMDVFLKMHNLEAEYPGAAYFARINELPARLVRPRLSRYSHENTIELDMDWDGYNNFENDDIRGDVYEALYESLQDEWQNLETDILDICRGYMRDLYRKLEKEYDYLTSDSAVWETIVANDLHVLEAA
jgi:hypothetical protein